MNKKNGFVVASTLFLIIALFSAPLTFAQIWDSVIVSAYATSVVEDGLGEGNIEFVVVVPPAGLEITNSISAQHIQSGESRTINLTAGDQILLTFANMRIDNYSVELAAEPNHHIIYYEGQAGWIWLNAVDIVNIPEFSPILVVPMFIVATAIAIVYRRKRTSQNQTTD